MPRTLFAILILLGLNVGYGRVVETRRKKTYKSMLRIADFAFIPPDDSSGDDALDKSGEEVSKKNI
jgi:hypothetical protein